MAKKTRKYHEHDSPGEGDGLAYEERLSSDHVFGRYDGFNAAQFLQQLMIQNNQPITAENLLRIGRLEGVVSVEDAKKLLEEKAVPGNYLSNHFAKILQQELRISKNRFINECWYSSEYYEGPMLPSIDIMPVPVPRAKKKDVGESHYHPIPLGSNLSNHNESEYFKLLKQSVRKLAERADAVASKRKATHSRLSEADDAQLIQQFCKYFGYIAWHEHLHVSMLKGLCPLPTNANPDALAEDIAGMCADLGSDLYKKLYMLGRAHFESIQTIDLDRAEYCSESIFLLRKHKGWTQEQLAERAGVNTDAVKNYEKGDYSYTIKPLVKILDACEVSESVRKQALAPLKKHLGYTDLSREKLTLAQIIKNARIDAGLLQSELAEAVGVCENSISNYEYGDKPSLPTLDKILTVCKVSQADKQHALLLLKTQHGYTDLPLENLTLGQLIRNARIDAGFEHPEHLPANLAPTLGISKKTLASYEKNTFPPNLELLENILDAYRVNESICTQAIMLWKKEKKILKPIEQHSYTEICKNIMLSSNTDGQASLTAIGSSAHYTNTIRQPEKNPLEVIRLALSHDADFEKIMQLREVWKEWWLHKDSIHVYTVDPKLTGADKERALYQKFDTAWEQANKELEAFHDGLVSAPGKLVKMATREQEKVKPIDSRGAGGGAAHSA